MSSHKYSDRIPPDVLTVPNVKRLADVLDDLGQYKMETVYQFTKAYNWLLTTDVNFLRKWLYQLGQLQTIDGMPLYLYERMIYRAYDIFALKGSFDGLTLLAWAMMDADVQWDVSKVYSNGYIVLDDVTYGYTPNGQDLGDAGTDKFLYCFDDNTAISDYYSDIVVTLAGPYFHVGEFRTLVAEELPRFLPGYCKETTRLTIKFYSGTYVPITTLYIGP